MFRLGRARNAVVTQDRAGRQVCDLRQECLWGCPRGAIYDSREDLARLRLHPNFKLADNAHAVSLRHDGAEWEVTARDGRGFRAPRVLLAAGCLATTQLAIGALPEPPPGLRLLNSPVMAFALLVPSQLGKRPAARGHSLAQLGYRYAIDGDYVTGALYEASTLPAWSFTARLPLSRRAGFRLFPAARAGVAGCHPRYFPSAFSDNRLTWSRAGNAVRLSINGGTSPALDATAARVSYGLRRQFRAIGGWMLPGRAFAPQGADVHYAATLPMGGSGPAATTRRGELRSAPGVFVVDGACLPSLAPKYPTLTIMANAARIGHHLASGG